MVKIPPANAGDVRDSVSIPGSGRSPGEGNGNPLRYWRVCKLSHVHLFASPWTVATSGDSSVCGILPVRMLVCVTPGDLPNPGIKPESLTSPALAGKFFSISATWEAQFYSWKKWRSLSRVQLFVTPWTLTLQGLLFMEFSRQEHRMGSRSLLQGIFPTQALSPGLPNCRWILYHLCHQGSPRQCIHSKTAF